MGWYSESLRAESGTEVLRDTVLLNMERKRHPEPWAIDITKDKI